MQFILLVDFSSDPYDFRLLKRDKEVVPWSVPWTGH